MNAMFKNALTAAQEVGRHGARWDETARMLDIMESEFARARPQSAWELLPLGWDVEQTIAQLRRLPIETDPDIELYERRVKLLRERDAEVEGFYREYLDLLSKAKEGQHVQ